MKFGKGGGFVVSLTATLLVYITVVFGVLLVAVNAKPADFCCRIYSAENRGEPHYDICIEEKS